MKQRSLLGLIEEEWKHNSNSLIEYINRIKLSQGQEGVIQGVLLLNEILNPPRTTE
jgi:hypothetical protein